NRLRDGADRRVVADEFLHWIVVLVVLLPLDGPATVVGVEDGNLRAHRGVGEGGGGLLEFLADLRYFVEEWNGRSIGSHDDAVILLLSAQGAAPLPVADRVGAVTDVVPRHRAHFSFIECVVDARPIDRPRLRFDDPKILLLEAAREV